MHAADFAENTDPKPRNLSVFSVRSAAGSIGDGARNESSCLAMIGAMPGSRDPLWTPSPDRIAAANLTRFAGGAPYAELYEWSISEPAEFWARMWQFGGVIGERGRRIVDDLDRMPGAAFFPDARINFTENVLR